MADWIDNYQPGHGAIPTWAKAMRPEQVLQAFADLQATKRKRKSVPTLTKLQRIHVLIARRLQSGLLNSRYVRRHLRILDANEREQLKLWLLSNYLNFPAVQLIVQQWDTLLADNAVYELIENSAPVILDTNVGCWKVRVMYNRLERKRYLDVRYWELKDSLFYPTMNGIVLPVSSWFKLFDVVAQLLMKHK